MRFAVAREGGVKADDAGCPSFLQPRRERIALSNSNPAEIEDLKRTPAPSAQSGDTLQGLQIVIEGWPDESPNLEVVSAARLPPIVKPVNEPLEA